MAELLELVEEIRALTDVIGIPNGDPESKKPKTVLAALDDLSYKLMKIGGQLERLADAAEGQPPRERRHS